MSHSLLSCVQKTAVTLTAVSALAFSQLSNAAFSQIISFGDSLSDTGNVAIATSGTSPNPAFGYADGNFSNGDIWLDYLGDSLNTGTQSASLAGGTNHAWGGARTTVTDSVPSAQAQIAGYLASNTVDPNALYTLLIGGNDINAFDGITVDQAYIAAAGQAAAGLVGSLIAAGAENVMVLNVPDVGAAPVAPAGLESTLTGLSALYNGNLAAGLAGLDQSKITVVDLFTIGQTITANVNTNGLDNVSDACLTTSGVCATPGTYLYWDALHPTTAAHALIADAALATVVPVPAALPLMIFALSGLVGARKLRAQ